MISVIFPYRERDLNRVRRSLESLKKQYCQDFEVYFIDYGSSVAHANAVALLMKDYSFVNYSYLYTEQQPWNKSKALNTVIKQLKTSFFFVADIDMIFHPNFIGKAYDLLKKSDIWYFKVGFLSEVESKKEKDFENYYIKFQSNREATGLTLCSVEKAKFINGFDEFYHFWGSEDTDFHVRLINAGYEVNYYEASILMLHQWHKTYRNKESKTLKCQLQLRGIVQFNQLYLEAAIRNKVTKVNTISWGEVISKSDFIELQQKRNSIEIFNSVTQVNYFIFQQLPNLKKGCHHFQFKTIALKERCKIYIKSVLKSKKVMSSFLTLKEINDMLLYHIVNDYHHYKYTYQVSDDLKSIYLSIKMN